jgi:hypothetical protein
MAKWEDYEPSFVAAVRAALSPGMDIERDVYISDITGLAILRRSNGAMQPLGCPLCLIGKQGQDTFGYPTINNRVLISGEEATEVPADTPVEILSNLWLCPQCRMPQEGLLPAFTGRQATRPE